MALNIGTIYAQLTAQADSFSKAMAGGTKDLERFAREAKRVSAEVAQASAIVAGFGAAAVRLAASVDGPTKKAMTGLENSTKLLAVQVADMLLPAVRELTSMFKTAAGVVAGLDPEVKKQISSMAVLAVQVAVAAKAFSVFSGLASNVFSVLRAGFAMVAAVGVGPLLNMVAAVGLVIAAVLLLHRAWRKNWGGIQEATKSVLEWLRSGIGQLATFFGKVWDFLLDGAHDFIEGLLKVAEKIEELSGGKVKFGENGVAGLRGGVEGLFKDLKSGAFFSEAFEFGKTIAQEIGDGLAEEARLVRKEVAALLDFGGVKTAKTIKLGRGMPGDGPSHSGAASRHSTAATHAVAERDRSGSMKAPGGLSREDMISGAVGAADWGQAQAILKTGLDGAADFGTTLQVWGERMSGVFARAGQDIFGAVGSLVSSIAEGAKQGGVWGAFMAAIMEVVKSAASAMEFLGTALNFVKQLGAMIEPMVKPVFDVLTDVLGAVLKILQPIFSALKPLFELITNVISYLFPILSALGSLFEAVGPILEVVFRVVGQILQILEPIFKLVGGVIKVVATVILGFLVALNEIAAAFGDTKARAEARRLRGVVDNMWKEGADTRFRADSRAAGGALRNADAQEAAADAADKMTEALLNVPEGFKIANARYIADMGISSRRPAAGDSSSGPAPVFGFDQVDPSAGAPPVPYDDPGEMAWYNAYSDAIAAGKGQARATEEADAARAAANAKSGSGGSQKSSGPGFKTPGSTSSAPPMGGGVGGGAVFNIYGDIVLSGADTESLQSLGEALQREARRKSGQRTGNASQRRRGS